MECVGIAPGHFTTVDLIVVCLFIYFVIMKFPADISTAMLYSFM